MWSGAKYVGRHVGRVLAWDVCWSRSGGVVKHVCSSYVYPGRATVTGTLLSPHACEWNTAMQKKGMLTKSRNTCILFVRKCPHVQVGLP